MAQRKDDLHEAGHASSRLKMSDLRLDRSDTAATDRRLPARTARGFSERRRHALDLHRVTELGSGAVRLDVTDICGLQPGIVPCRQQEISLCAGIRGAQGTRVPTVPDRGSAENRPHVVAVLNRARQRLEGQDADALTPHVPVSRGTEGVAVTGRRGDSHLGGENVIAGGQHQADSADQDEFRLTRAKRPNGSMNGDKSARAGGIHDLTGTTSIQKIGQPVREHRVLCPGANLSSTQTGAGKHF